MRHAYGKMLAFAGIALAIGCVRAGAGDIHTTLEGELIDMGGQVAVTPTQPTPGAPATLAGEAPAYYDVLPLRLLDMDRYERIALEPYPDYDRMPLHEKAAIYSRQFEFMRNRKPNYAPDVLAAIQASEEGRPAPRQPARARRQPPPSAAETRNYAYENREAPPQTPDGNVSIYDTMKQMYKPPPPKQAKPKENLSAIPGPWGTGVQEPEPVPVDPDTIHPDYTVNPDGTIQFGRDARMETLRDTRSLRDMVKARR